MYNTGFNTPYNRANDQLTQLQQQQQQQYLLNEFLKTSEGQEAHNKFVEAQKLWWEQVNGIAPKQAPNSDAKINELEHKLDNMANLVTSLVEQLGGPNDK